jgi:formate dehydrogenase major subunit
MKEISRRDFLKVSTALAAGSAVGLSSPAIGLAVGASETSDVTSGLRIKGATETTTNCCYCSVGCGAICSVVDGDLVNFEGDPDHPINAGGMCSKGIGQFNVVNVYNPKTGKIENNPARIKKPMYRKPGATEYEEVTWDWAIAEIAKRVKDLRDKTFQTVNDAGVTVNRTEAIGTLGGAALNNEECHPLSKLARALGMVYIEHQARL